MIKLGCCIEIEELSAACNMGYDFVDFSGKGLVKLSAKETDILAAYLEEQNISCMGIHATLPKEIALIGDSCDLAALRQYTKQLLERARALKVRYIGIGSPNSRKLEPGISREDADRQMEAALTLICEMAPDMDILLESLNKEETNYINSLQEAYEMKKRVKKENIGLIWDIYHFMKSEEKTEELTRELLDCVKYLHIADPNGRKYPSALSSPKLFETMQKAIILTGIKYLAVEALSTNFGKDAFYSRRILQQQIEKMEG